MEKYNEQWIKEKYDAIPLEERDHYVLVSLKIKHFRKLNRLYGRAYGDALIDRVYEEIDKQLGPDEYAAHIYLGYYNLLLKVPDIEKDDYSLLIWLSKFSHNIHAMDDDRFREMIFFGIGVYLLDKTVIDFYVAQYNADICRSESNEKDFLISHLEIYGSSYKEKGLHDLDYRNRFKPALMQGNIKMYLQPKVCLQDGTITHAEALMRWFDEEGNLLPINEYLPVLEECGLTNKVDCFMFEQACKMVLNWKEKYHRDIHISVNLSKNTFVYPFFLSEFDEIHKNYPCDKKCIELELLESIILNQTERVSEVAEEIKEHGYTCSLDDFGSGYSSYGVLTNTSLDMLKIDRSLFQNEKNLKELKLIKHIIGYAHEIGLKVVAEGIETQGYVTYLKKLNCDYIQGFVLYKPMCLEDFEYRFLKNNEIVNL